MQSIPLDGIQRLAIVGRHHFLHSPLKDLAGSVNCFLSISLATLPIFLVRAKALHSGLSVEEPRLLSTCFVIEIHEIHCVPFPIHFQMPPCHYRNLRRPHHPNCCPASLHLNNGSRNNLFPSVHLQLAPW